MGTRQFLRLRRVKFRRISDRVQSILNRKFNSDYDNETFLRLWDHSFIHEDCWIHNASRDKDGYGKLYYNYRNTSAHRVSAHLFLEFNLDSDKQINHKSICLDKACWNPEHIYIGTHSENMLDSVVDGTHINASKTHCPCGREYDSYEGTKYGVTRRCSTCRKLSNHLYHIGKVARAEIKKNNKNA